MATFILYGFLSLITVDSSSAQDVNYYMAQNFQSCDSLCKTVGQVCAAENHGFDSPERVNSTFFKLKIACQFSSPTIYNSSSEPHLLTTGNPPGVCSGTNHVPKAIDCQSQPRAANIRRLCPYLDQRACKKVQFKSAVSNKALKGHKLKTHRVVSEDICQIECVSHERCTSYNLGPPTNHGLRDCDLSSSDAIRHPNDLSTHNGYIYRETKSPCSHLLCLESQTCVSLHDNTDKYECVCPEGWTGDYCSQDIDECDTSNGVYSCDYEAWCTNTAGSFYCACKEGFIGEGKICIDIDECSPSLFKCHADATCVNIAGSYSCKCEEPYIGDGVTNCSSSVTVEI